MPTVSDEYAAISTILVGTYDRLDKDQIRQLLRHFLTEDAGRFCAALDAHITDPDKGRFPPRPADLTARLVVAPPEPYHEADTGESHEVTVPEWVAGLTGLRGSLRLYRSACPHCADSGLAWYYHEPAPTGPRKRQRVWTSDEAMALGEGQFAALRLRAARNAICSCTAGQRHHPDRERYTSLRRVLELADERRGYENVQHA